MSEQLQNAPFVIRDKIFLAILTLLCLNFIQAQAQTKKIVGSIKDETGQAMSGVGIKVKDQNGNSAVSDLKGSYSINVPSSEAILVFTFIGYGSQEVAVGNRTTINISMSPTSSSLNELVVIGYGLVERKDITGAIASIKPTQEDATQFSSVDQLLKGRASGVQVTTGNAAPGSVSSVRIRGINSLRSDNEPLYVIDGIIVNTATNDNNNPYSQSGVSGSGNAGQEKQNGLTGINTQDIESIEILKDASATAIYGSRGANGVVIITTKRGKAGSAEVNFSVNTEFSEVTKKYDMLDGQGYARYMNAILTARGNTTPRYNPDTIQTRNWQDVLFGTGTTQTYRLSARGGSKDKSTTYFVAGGFLGANGVVDNTGLKQGDLRLNLGQKLSNKFKLDFSMTGIYRLNNMTTGTEPLGGSTSSFISQAILAVPFARLDLDPNNDDTYANPLSWIDDYNDISKELRVQGNLGVTYTISKTFTYKLNLAGDARNKDRSRWYGYDTYQGSLVRGSLGVSNANRSYYLVENLLMFNKTLKKDHRFDGTIGVTYDQENNRIGSVVNENFFAPDLRIDGLGYGSSIYLGVPDRTRVELFSVLARLNYAYKGKYLITLSGRADGSSKFRDDNKFAYFPSASVAWRINREDFMSKLNYISDLKLRVGFGITGNQGVTPYNTFARYNSTVYPNPGGGLLIGVGPGNIQNEKLKWESTRQVNTGLDLSILNNRFSFTIDAYYKKTTDLLQAFTLPFSTGFPTIIKNFGSLENKGIEFAFDGNLLNKNNFKLDLGANISFNRNRILDLGLQKGNIGTLKNIAYYLGNGISNGSYLQSPANIFIEGSPIGLFYGLKTDGVYQNTMETAGKTLYGAAALPGDLRYVDQNGDNNVNDDDKVILGNPNPDFTYGFSTTFSYKKLSLGLFFNGIYGNEVINGNLARMASLDGVGTNVLRASYNDAWSATNPSRNTPRLDYSLNRFTDRLVENGSFLRLATATLKYQLPINNSKLFKQVSVSVTGRNLFLISNYSGFDPEVNSFAFDPNRVGIDWNSYPNTRGITFGINTTF